MSELSIPLGLFDLLELVGTGSSGEVWRGVHRSHGANSPSLAVKILDLQTEEDPRLQAVFRREVQAVAALDHPRIVRVFDYGTLPAETEEATGGKLVAGSPYLVMEYLGGGTLYKLVGKMPWSELRWALLGLLDALAHSHARGVLHRDIKPGNVLLGGRGVTLTDFGLGHGLLTDESGPDLERLEGTPAYMAPEQFECRWRDYGPWTDLYALGCLAYTLASGSPPFGSRVEFERSMFGHLYQEPPPLEALAPVPDGFEPWVRRLIAKDPVDRFRWATDAAFGLAALEGAGSPPRPRETQLPEEDDAPTLYMDGPATLSLPLELGAELQRIYRQALRGALAGDSAKSICPVAVAPLPQDWRPPSLSPGSPRLKGVGLGLYGLRTVPLVGRNDERDALWQALHVVRDTGTTRMVVLRGFSGVGKSRLAEWLCERAHELGGATILRAGHSPQAGPGDGLRPMIERSLRCAGLARAEVEVRVEQWLSRGADAVTEGEGAVLSDLVARGSDEGSHRSAGPESRLSPIERNLLIERFLARQCLGRPVVLCLDDVQWGMESLLLARHLLGADRQAPLPILILATVGDEALAEQLAEASLLDELLQRAGVSLLPIGPLPASDRPTLIRQLLGFEGDLAAEVEERTAGNPLFAVQLVADWVRREILVPGTRGFQLRDGATVALPDDLHQVWNEQVERLLEGRPEGEEVPLQLAAFLGRDVGWAEWDRLCVLEGVVPIPELVDTLVDRRLATLNWDLGFQGGWSFVHALFREALQRRAGEQGRAVGFHRRCASLLEKRSAPEPLERRARHLVGAGDLEDALPPLLGAGRGLVHSGDFRRAEVVLGRHRAVLDQLGLPEGDPRRIEGAVVEVALARDRGELERAGQLAKSAVERATEANLPLLVADAMMEEATLLSTHGELVAARQAFEVAGNIYREHGDHEGQSRCDRALAFTLISLGEVGVGEAIYEQVLGDCERSGNFYGQCAAWIGLVRVAVLAGRLEQAAERVAIVLRLSRDSGSRLILAHAHNMDGEVRRQQQDLAGAEAAYRRALELFSAVGAGDADVARCNLGFILVDRGEYLKAIPLLNTNLLSFEASERWGHVGLVHSALAVCAAVIGDWETWDRHVGRADALAQQTHMVEIDTAQMVARAGELAQAEGQVERARVAYSLARRQWDIMGRREETAELDRRIAALEGGGD